MHTEPILRKTRANSQPGNTVRRQLTYLHALAAASRFPSATIHHLRVALLLIGTTLSGTAWAQTMPEKADTSAASSVLKKTTVYSAGRQNHISLESDPAFWLGTAGNGPAVDANVNVRLAAAPQWRFGLLGYSGTWRGDLARTLLLTADFTEANWQVLWRGVGLETQYQFRFGRDRGGLQPGVRLQWNQFNYQQQETTLATANHFVVTPQVGFQWFPFTKLGLYLLPWTGVQLPVAGTDQVTLYGNNRATRRAMFVATAHIGWEFRF